MGRWRAAPGRVKSPGNARRGAFGDLGVGERQRVLLARVEADGLAVTDVAGELEGGLEVSADLAGRVKPHSLRTNCSAAARISSSVAGGWKLWSVRMFRHIGGAPW